MNQRTAQWPITKSLTPVVRLKMFGWIGLFIASLLSEPVLSKETQVVLDDVWTRGRRISISDSDWHLRDPSLIRTANGDLLLLFTRISQQQQEQGTGELVAVRSRDNAASWSDPVVVYAPSTNTTPRTMGTVTALDSGKLIGLVVEVGKARRTMRRITSDDEGRTWSLAKTTINAAGTSLTPYGRMLQIDGWLAVGAYGTMSTQEQQSPFSQAGLLRSDDGGRTWGDFSLIAYRSDIDFKDPAVVRTEGRRLVALVAGKSKSKPSPTNRWSVFRTVSDDLGQTWSEPVTILFGEQPCLMLLPDGQLACAEVHAAPQSAYAWLRFQTSDNHFRTWQNYQDCWGIRYFKNTGFVGRPAMLALDQDTIFVAFSRTRWTAIHQPGQVIHGLPIWVSSGEQSDASNINQERIEGTFFRHTQRKPVTSATPPAPIPDWEWVEDRVVFPEHIKGGLRGIKKTASGALFAMEEVGEFGQGRLQIRTSADAGKSWSEPRLLPSKALEEKRESGHSARPVLGTITRDGRWLLVLPKTLIKRGGYVNEFVRNDEKGFGLWKSHGQRWGAELYILYSDDQGHTWKGLDKPVNTSPLNQVAWSHTGIHEQDDGTLVINLWGSKTSEDVSAGIAGIILLRSRDGGTNWGDPTIVAYGTPENGYRFSENDFVVYPDDTWVFLSRLAFRRRMHNWGLATVRMVSHDRGRTWSDLEPVFTGGHPMLALLSDGGLVCGGSGGLYISYDKGRSWVQKDAYPNSRPIPLSDGTLMVEGGHSHREWTIGRILKRTIPNSISACD